MRKENFLKQKFASGLFALGTFNSIPSGSVVNVIGCAGFDFVVIDAEHGPIGMEVAEDLIRAAEIARRAGVRFQINTTICKINIDEVVGIIELAKRLGAYCFDAFILVPTGRGEKIADEILDPLQYEILLNELLRLKLESTIELRVTCGPQFARVCKQARIKKLIGSVSGCMGGRGFGFISYQGDVQTCGFLDISAGNLIENGFNFKKIWLGSEFLKEVRDVSGYKGKCRTCEYVGVCGGCRARAYAMSGDYLGVDPVCKFVKRQTPCSGGCLRRDE